MNPMNSVRRLNQSSTEHKPTYQYYISLRIYTNNNLTSLFNSYNKHLAYIHTLSILLVL